MTTSFYKYQGTGNDFVMIDDRSLSFEADNLSLIQALCHRRLGVGSDGLILLRTREGYDFEMVYFNADGSQSMCGNGARCAVSFAAFLGMCGNECHFMAVDGPHTASIKGNIVELEMSPVHEFLQIDDDYFINTGAPHHIRFVENINHYPVVLEGAKVRYNKELYPQGTNVNFVTELGKGSIQVRTYERGVEDETLSCGTGVTACALLYGKLKELEDVCIETKGGNLKVRFNPDGKGGYKNIRLIGPAEQVFQGIIHIPQEALASN
ncbi:MAG TPA: diaminopimelate epimerase [Lunatimonas sp.]|nr:diaminopimelate epimerase [Lunatimonas sp.]